MTKSISDTLAERQHTHGDYSDHARAAGRLKEVIRNELERRQQRGQKVLSFEMEETLDMIAHKIGRILAGNAEEPDHWHDIAGYATLVEQRVQEPAPTKSVRASPSTAADADSDIMVDLHKLSREMGE